VASRRRLLLAFTLSGFAGLVYEVLWTRYLALYVGHSAFAQVLVLAVYLGGMAIGALATADLSKRIARPLLWYAATEGLLACFGLAFHPIFQLATRLSYDWIFPALVSGPWVGSARWLISGLLILPQAVALGASFPLMASSLVRLDAARPGRGIARVYLLNTLGGALGVLVAGFWMIAALGLPGTSVAAAALNAAAAALVLLDARAAAETRPADRASRPTGPGATATDGARRSDPRGGPFGLLLAVSFGTALASFAYEVGWIRMLSLVLGSATHSFELMLSAFILGLAVGAWWIEDRVDASPEPVALLGWIQVLMGLAAALSVPLFYFASFRTVGAMVQALPGTDTGYALFNVGRYGLCLLVMLPSTVLAGMTLPLITGSALRSGVGEEAIGRVYGANTLGSVVGAGAAGLLALPLLGLKGLILAGAGLDIALGLWVLHRVAGRSGRDRAQVAVAAALGAAALAGIQLGFRADDLVMTSGVYRSGEVPDADQRRVLYYADGLTATVSAHIGARDGVTVLATNGKPDASLGPLWRLERRDTLPARPLPAGRDFTTQVLAPIVALAHRPDARTIANIGHGSGMTAASFLTSPRVDRLVTIEIEPLMVEASAVFLPVNQAAFSDPRATYVFDDAKSYFSYRQERFDVIFAEPSNPWVTGSSSLFTKEFYSRVSTFLADGGVMAQWMQIYELDDDLFLSVLAALDEAFASYRVYLVGDSDVAIVASAGPLPEPDWSVLDTPGFLDLTLGIPRFRAEHLSSLLLFDETTFRPLLRRDAPTNSDFHPVLDLGAERARFERTSAEGVYSFAASRIDLHRALTDQARAPVAYSPVPTHGLAPAVFGGRGAWLRSVYSAGAGIAPEDFSDWQYALLHLQTFLEVTAGEAAVMSWPQWAVGFDRAESELHWGTNGWVDTTFYRTVYDYLDRADAPAEPRAAVDLRRASSLGLWSEASSAAALVVARTAEGEQWAAPETLLDVTVLSHLRAGRPEAARTALEVLLPLTGRSPRHLRSRLLEALVADAEQP